MTSARPKILVHIVTWNNQGLPFDRSVEAILKQGWDLGSSLAVHLTDNASTDGTAIELAAIRERYQAVDIFKNDVNLGFAGAHNQGVRRFLQGGFDFLLILNPDALLEPGALEAFCRAAEESPAVGLVTPKLLRCSENFDLVLPATIDAAGMRLTSSLRHLDRGSGEEDRGQFDASEDVFGGTGAALFMRRSCVEDLIVSEYPPDIAALGRVFPELPVGIEDRSQLFDEAFFAYREDADLAWRAVTRGWRCRYEPAAVVRHVRRVVPERRAKLAPEINAHGVRNRFLLQLNNFVVTTSVKAFLSGCIVRNLLVILGVLVSERTSVVALRQAIALGGRALRRRRFVVGKTGSDPRRVARWIDAR